MFLRTSTLAEAQAMQGRVTTREQVLVRQARLCWGTGQLFSSGLAEPAWLYST